MAGIPASIQAAAASIMVIVALGGIAYRFTIKPIKEQAEAAKEQAGTAVSRADTAVSRAEDAEEAADDIAARVDGKLDGIDTTLEGIQQSLAEQAREARGRTFTMYRLTEAIRKTDAIDTEKIPDVDEDDFLRGGRDHSYDSEDSDS